MIRYDNIPLELKNLPQWVCATASDKIPMQATKLGFMALSTAPNTWSSFEDALTAVNNKFYDYCGFVFNDNGYVAIDIDDGIDSDGLLYPLSSDIIGRCGSYTEKSKSGTGFHIIVKGDLPFSGKNNRQGVEIYKVARYFIMTGDVLLFDKIVENQAAIDYIVDTYFKQYKDSKNTYTNRVYRPEWSIPKGNVIPTTPNYPTILDGCRNISLTSLGGYLHTLGYDRDAIYVELTKCNLSACKPPLDDTEVSLIVNSVTRYIR